MCRVFGAVSAAPVSVRYELLDAPNPLIRQSEEHDSGWGIAAYHDIGDESPTVERFPMAAHADGRFTTSTQLKGRIFNVHVRRATFGGLSPENTHPFEFGPYTFSHNGTILDFRALLRPGMTEPRGETDSECFFLRLMNELDPDEPVRSLRGVVATIIASTTFSGLNFLFSDGLKLYAYRLGVFDLFWTVRDGIGLVSSEQLTAEPWHRVQQDVLLTLDPEQPEDPHAERLVGDLLLESARIEPLEPDASIRGAERGALAARRAAREIGLRAGTLRRNGGTATGVSTAPA